MIEHLVQQWILFSDTLFLFFNLFFTEVYLNYNVI